MEQEQQVVWYILHPFTPPELESDAWERNLLEESLTSHHCCDVLLKFWLVIPSSQTHGVLSLNIGTSRVPHKPPDKWPGVEFQKQIETCFSFATFGSFSISLVGDHVFFGFLISSHLPKNESMIRFFFTFSHRKWLAALWKSLRNRRRRNLPESHGGNSLGSNRCHLFVTSYM